MHTSDWAYLDMRLFRCARKRTTCRWKTVIRPLYPDKWFKYCLGNNLCLCCHTLCEFMLLLYPCFHTKLKRANTSVIFWEYFSYLPSWPLHFLTKCWHNVTSIECMQGRNSCTRITAYNIYHKQEAIESLHSFKNLSTVYSYIILRVLQFLIFIHLCQYFLK